MIDARALHGWLGNKDRFATWIKDRIDQYGFAEPDDFVCIGNSRSKGQRGGHNRKDYLLTLDMAKELAMVERTEVGRSFCVPTHAQNAQFSGVGQLPLILGKGSRRPRSDYCRLHGLICLGVSPLACGWLLLLRDGNLLRESFLPNGGFLQDIL